MPKANVATVKACTEHAVFTLVYYKDNISCWKRNVLSFFGIFTFISNLHTRWAAKGRKSCAMLKTKQGETLGTAVIRLTGSAPVYTQSFCTFLSHDGGTDKMWWVSIYIFGFTHLSFLELWLNWLTVKVDMFLCK